MSTFDALLLIGESAALLFLLWRILDLTFDAIEQWQQSLRDQQHQHAEAHPESLEAAPATRERGN